MRVPGQAGRPGGKAAGGGSGGFSDVPRVRLAMPPVPPLPPPGSSPWWLHQEPVPALVVGGDVDVFSARLLGGEAPSVDVVGTFLLLIRVGSFLLQLLPFVFCPPVLEPHFHLGKRERRALTGVPALPAPARDGAATRQQAQFSSEIRKTEVPVPPGVLPLPPCPDSVSLLWPGGMGETDAAGCGLLQPPSSALLPIPARRNPIRVKDTQSHLRHGASRHTGPSLQHCNPVPITPVSGLCPDQHSTAGAAKLGPVSFGGMMLQVHMGTAIVAPMTAWENTQSHPHTSSEDLYPRARVASLGSGQTVYNQVANSR